MGVAGPTPSNEPSRPERRGFRRIAAKLLRSPRASSLLPLSVLLVGGVLTATNWLNLTRNEAAKQERELLSRAESIRAALAARLLAYETVLHSAAGLLHASEQVTEAEWRTFSSELPLATLYPGLQGLGFARRLAPGEPSPPTDPDLTFESVEHAVDPDRDRTAIVYIEPRGERNERVIGFDMMSEPTRRHAMERARDSGRAALTSSIALLRTSDLPSEPGFIIYLPIYTDGPAPRGVSERRARLNGFVYGPFRATTFIDSVLRPLPEDLSLEIRDAGITGKAGALFRHGDRAASVLAREVVLSTHGHRWLIHLGALPSFLEARRSSEPLWTLVAGGTTTALLAALVLALAIARQNLANRLRMELLMQERDRYAASVLDNSLDAYVAITVDDRIIEWNRQAEVTFGWSRSEATGRRLVDTIVPERFRAGHLSALQTFGTRPNRLVGRRFEMPALCADGTEITVELSIVVTQTKLGTSFAASLRDVTELRRQRLEILELNATLERRIAERTAALAEANHSLQEANEHLESFARNVCHDLRAPLRAIHGYTSLALNESQRLEPSSRRHLANAQRSVDQMQRIIEDLLRLAFVRQQPVKKERVNLWSLILKVIGEAGDPNPPQIRATPDDLGDVFADPALLTLALRNLVSNAMKFSARVSEPVITFGSELVDGERAYFIRDNGIGFDPKYADQLFGVFQRLHVAEGFEGTGVGLTIVKKVIDRHGGRIWASSEAGHGATFWFTLA